MIMKCTDNQCWEGSKSPKVVTGSWTECPTLSRGAAGFLCSALEKAACNASGRCVSPSEDAKENYPKTWLIVVSQ